MGGLECLVFARHPIYFCSSISTLSLSVVARWSAGWELEPQVAELIWSVKLVLGLRRLLCHSPSSSHAFDRVEGELIGHVLQSGIWIES